MAEYWKSTPRKFCDFCKCWLADNKASIQFHENGKNHKENVAKKIIELRRKGLKDQRDKAQFDEDMKRIEEAALQAYEADVYKNPDVTGIEVQKKVEEVTGTKIEVDSDWYEAKSEEGHVYYWNIKTQATQWEKPACGFLTLEAQQRIAEKEPEEPSKSGGVKLAKPALVFKKKPKKEEKKEETSVTAANTVPEFGPMPAKDPYGQWEALPEKQAEPTEPIDLQLPDTGAVEIAVPELKPDNRFSFKTKTVESIGGQAEFKKRKVKDEVKRNVRSRGEE